MINGAIKALGLGLCACTLAGASPASSRDFFSSFFGGFGYRNDRAVVRMPFASEGFDDGFVRRRNTGSYSRATGGQAFCVRTCDGRYFPVSGSGEKSKAASCAGLCPATETQVFYGSTIDNATTEKGRKYSELPGAFKYRTALVSGCTCNGKSTGLAPVKIEDDPTVRRGDIVAGADGLLVNRGSEQRGASLRLSPAAATD